MKKFFNEFKKFISRGNVLDLAVAVIIGAAFGKITTSLVNDLVMPLISLAIGGLSVADWKWVIRPADVVDGIIVRQETALMYGNFIQTIIDFLLIAFVVFLILKIFNAANKSIADLTVLDKTFSKAEIQAFRKAGKTNKEIKELKIERQAEFLRLEEEAKANAPKQASVEELLTEIRDLLKKNNEK